MSRAPAVRRFDPATFQYDDVPVEELSDDELVYEGRQAFQRSVEAALFGFWDGPDAQLHDAIRVELARREERAS